MMLDKEFLMRITLNRAPSFRRSYTELDDFCYYWCFVGRVNVLVYC